MNSPLRSLFFAVAVLAAASFVRAQSVSTAGESATLTIGAFPPFTVSCSITDIDAGWKVIYPDRKQAEPADGRQNLVYRTVAGSAFTAERHIEESPGTVRITDSFPEEAASLKLSKVLDVEFPGIDLESATVEFVNGNKPELNGQTLSHVADLVGRESVTSSGLTIASPAGEKLTVEFSGPRSMRIGHIADEKRNIFVFRIGYPEAPSKSTVEFRLGAK